MKKIFLSIICMFFALTINVLAQDIRAEVKAIETAMNSDNEAKVKAAVNKISKPSSLNAVEEAIYAEGLTFIAAVTNNQDEAIKLQEKAVAHLKSAIKKDKAAVDKHFKKGGLKASEVMEIFEMSLEMLKSGEGMDPDGGDDDDDFDDED